MDVIIPTNLVCVLPSLLHLSIAFLFMLTLLKAGARIDIVDSMSKFSQFDNMLLPYGE